MPYVNVPNDLSKIKTKMAFNLTKRQLVCFGGAAAALFHLGAISQGVSGLFGLLIVQPGQQMGFVVSIAIAYAGGFLLTYFFGVDEDRINEVYGD